MSFIIMLCFLVLVLFLFPSNNRQFSIEGLKDVDENRAEDDDLIKQPTRNIESDTVM